MSKDKPSQDIVPDEKSPKPAEGLRTEAEPAKADKKDDELQPLREKSGF